MSVAPDRWGIKGTVAYRGGIYLFFQLLCSFTQKCLL